LSLNARSVLNKLDDLQATILDLQPDVIGITESWVHSNISDAELYLPGFSLFRRDRKTGNKGGGVLLYVREALNATDFSTKSDYGEHVWCEINDLCIGVTYRSDNMAIVGSENEEQLRNVLYEVCSKHILLMGDFNYPNIDWLSSVVDSVAPTGAKEFLDAVEGCFLTQHVKEPTRGDAILDLVFTSDPDLVSDLQILHPLSTSDHNMIMFTVHLQTETVNSVKVIRDYNRGDFDKIKSSLAEINWDHFMDASSNECWLRFRNLLQKLIEQYVPLKNNSRKKGPVDKKPIWMTHKALKLVRRKRKAFSKYKSAHHPAVKAACKATKSELRSARRNFECKLAQNIKKDSKSFYAYARSKMKCKVQTSPLITDNGSRTSSPEDMVGLFNNYFTSVFTAEDLTNIPPVSDGPNVQCCDINFTVEDVSSGLSKLRPDKAAGPDDLLPRFLLQIADCISYPLYLLFRKSLDENSVPDDWKNANICPIFKKGSRNNVENYRPISLTSQICKLFESIIRDNIVNHLEGNQLILDSQHGFRKGRSCLSNILAFLEKVTSAVDSGEDVDVVFLDFAKAFDKVPHQRLLLKLKLHGICDKLLHWISNWLTNRKQRVCIGGTYSSWQFVLSGVPQGSVLGPILFLIYINDIDCGICNWILKFADDTKMFGPICNKVDYMNFQKDLNRLFDWSKNWQMSFNIDKCKVMHLGRTNKVYDYYLDGQPLSEVKEEKDLGIVISKDLKVSRQCSTAYSKANRVLGIINRTFVNKHSDIMLKLYKSTVRPHLEYCTAAWSPHYKKDKELLEKIQRRFTRMIPEIKDLPYTERLRHLKLWSLEERRIRADLVEVFKMLNGLTKVKFATFFELDTTSRTRGHPYKLKKRRFNTDLRKHFFTERIINIWNSLDGDTVRATTLNMFKNRLDHLRVTGWMGLHMDS